MASLSRQSLSDFDKKMLEQIRIQNEADDAKKKSKVGGSAFAKKQPKVDILANAISETNRLKRFGNNPIGYMTKDKNKDL